MQSKVLLYEVWILVSIRENNDGNWKHYNSFTCVLCQLLFFFVNAKQTATSIVSRWPVEITTKERKAIKQGIRDSSTWQSGSKGERGQMENMDQQFVTVQISMLWFNGLNNWSASSNHFKHKCRNHLEVNS